MFINSIRWRMQIWLAFLLVIILSGFGFTAFQLYRMNRFKEIDGELERRVASLVNDVSIRQRMGKPPEPPPKDDDIFRELFDEPKRKAEKTDSGGRSVPPPPKPPEKKKRQDGMGMDRGGFGAREIKLSGQTIALFNEEDKDSYYFVVWSREANALKRSTNAPPELQMPSRLDVSASIHTQQRGSIRESYHFTEIGECVVVGRNIADDLKALDRFAWRLCGTGAVILALGLGGGWLLTNRTIRPINEISSAANRISEGNLSERIDVADTDNELERLASVLNSTFARLDAAFTRQKQFTADASHELRTPLAVLISDAQTTLARERTTEEYRETLQECLETAQQMRRLTESLLELARSDVGQEQLAKEPYDLTATTEACVKKLQPIAQGKDVQIKAELVPVQGFGQVDRYLQVLTNLISNAIQYNKPGGEIRISVQESQGRAIIKVADTGIGISPEDLPHIFERFYRADKSRSRRNGHFGLGLAICKALVEGEQGTIVATSVLGQGSEFTVTLPTGKS